MSSSLKPLRIFIASPSDVGAEREIAREVVETLDKELAEHEGYVLRALGWEDVAPGRGRAQALINPLVRKADLLVGGTVETFRYAYRQGRVRH